MCARVCFVSCCGLFCSKHFLQECNPEVQEAYSVKVPDEHLVNLMIHRRLD